MGMSDVLNLLRLIQSRAFLLGVLCLLLGNPAARAHTTSASYLTLQVDGTNIVGRWDVALRDLHHGMGLDPAAVQSIPRPELARREEALALDIAAGLALRADQQPLKLVLTDYTTLPLNEVEYARLLFSAGVTSVVPQRIEVNARAIFRVDTNMHGFLRLEHGGRVDAVAFNVENSSHTFTLMGSGGGWSRWATFVSEGVWHIWIGFDHILFLLALLLPAVLRHEKGRWTGVQSFRSALVNVLKIVTAFTLAHSITLSLAALDIFRLPARFVESVIAASVALAALNNLWPWYRDRGWLVALGFGLIHGFGFANVLGELGMSGGSFAVALIGFNVGVEFGQLGIVALFLPAAFALRNTTFYRSVTLRYGSGLVIIIALLWMAERIAGWKLLPF